MNFQELKQQVIASPPLYIDIDEYGKNRTSQVVELDGDTQIDFDVDMQLKDDFRFKYCSIDITDVIWKGDRVELSIGQDADLSALLMDCLSW